MSRIFGPVRQMAFVVRDLDRALAYWTKTLGVGPFFVLRELPLERFEYRGAPSPFPKVTLALASSGDLQVELIYQHDDRPSGFLDCLRLNGEGLQHVAAWVDRAGYDASVEQLTSRGVSLSHQGWLPNGGPRFAFFATEQPGGFQFEVSDVGDPQFSGLGDTVREAARTWDGSNPIRELTI